MNKSRSRDDIEKRLRKIEKEETKAAKSLEKRRRELARALDDNERLIEVAVTRGRADKELKLEADIDKLARRLESMQDELSEMHRRREAHLEPLKDRSEDLRTKLKAVDAQLDAAAVAMSNIRRSPGIMNAGSMMEFPTSPNAPPPPPPADNESNDGSGASPPPYARYFSR